jgi:TetR/AcrR family transcriptional regulator, repressor for neighboring sulfatase
MATRVKSTPAVAPPPSRPRGRDEVVDAVLDAAERLFARSGFAAVSLRDIAADAGVTYSLINRHFGTKDTLLELLLDRYTERGLQAPEMAGDPAAVLTTLLGPPVSQGQYLRLLAWSSLGDDAGQAQGSKAVLDRLLPAPGPSGDVDAEARARTVAALALVFGWRFFHPFLVEALHVDTGDVPNLHHRIGELVAELVGGGERG